MTSRSPSQSVGGFFMNLSAHTETLSSDALTHERNHPSVLPSLSLSRKPSLFPGHVSALSVQAGVHMAIRATVTSVITCPAHGTCTDLTSKVPFLGKVLSNMALQHYLHTQ